MPIGTGISAGVGVAQALVWQMPIDYEFLLRKAGQPQQEIQRFNDALSTLLEKTDALRAQTERKLGAGEAAIFDAHATMLRDESGLVEPVRNRILLQGFSAEYAVLTQFDELAGQFLRMADDYLSQRADDVYDLRDQLLRILMGLPTYDYSHLDHATVLVAHALSPADLAMFDVSRLEGIVCETGGYSSHMAILARTLGIPAVVGAQGLLGTIRNGQLVALDGSTGEIWIEPNEAELAELRTRAEAMREQEQAAQLYRGLPTVTVDGHRLELAASVGSPEEVEAAVSADAESVGLYRTEMMHQNRTTLPTEEEQFRIFRTALEKMNGKPVTVRTFDDNGVRPVVPIKDRGEDNPMLGFRGIRLSLARPSFFRAQLRALLRASAYGPIRVMFPMISSLDELEEAQNAIANVKEELRREGTAFDEKMPVGILVETPASALLAEIFAARVDFLSIGINDLIQFTLAADRGNPSLAYLYHQYHPAILRFINWTVGAAHHNGIPCYMCGEAPGQMEVLPLLMGLGLDGFSLNPHMILRARQSLSKCNYADCQALAIDIMQMNHTSDAAKRLLGHTT